MIPRIDGSSPDPPTASEELERWLRSDGDKTLGGLVEVFDEKSFALLFVLLMGVPALPLPTGGVTMASEMMTIVLAVQLVAGRQTIWLPERWRGLELAGERRERLLSRLLRLIRRLERLSRPRLRFLFGHRWSTVVFGVLVVLGSTASMLAPPFTGLDTLPALGVVLISLGVLREDAGGVLLGVAVAIAGVVLELAVGGAALRGLNELL